MENGKPAKGGHTAIEETLMAICPTCSNRAACNYPDARYHPYNNLIWHNCPRKMEIVKEIMGYFDMYYHRKLLEQLKGKLM